MFPFKWRQTQLGRTVHTLLYFISFTSQIKMTKFTINRWTKFPNGRLTGIQRWLAMFQWEGWLANAVYKYAWSDLLRWGLDSLKLLYVMYSCLPWLPKFPHFIFTLIFYMLSDPLTISLNSTSKDGLLYCLLSECFFLTFIFTANDYHKYIYIMDTGWIYPVLL